MIKMRDAFKVLVSFQINFKDGKSGWGSTYSTIRENYIWKPSRKINEEVIEDIKNQFISKNPTIESCIIISVNYLKL